MALTLTAIQGPNKGMTFSFTGPGTFLAGRSGRAQCHFPSTEKSDLKISHAHFLVEVNATGCRVHDLQSHNGTFLNGERITTAPLRNEDKLKAGRTILRVTIDCDAETEWWKQGPASAATRERSTVPATPRRRAVSSSAARLASKKLCPACKKLAPMVGARVCSACQAASTAIVQNIPDYLLVRELGRGAMGVVHLAVRHRDAAVVAIKTLLTSAVPKAGQIQRFLREAEILKKLDHPHIVAFRDSGTTPGGQLYLVTDFIDGTDMARVLRQQGPMKVSTAIRAISQLLQALEYAHAKRIVHRDIKPANLLLQVESGRKTIKVADFGLARAYQESQLSGLTMQGDIGGTPAFMAPDQIRDYRGVEPAADQYAAAATLYNLLTGHYPHDPDPAISVFFARILSEDPVPLRTRRPVLPKTLEDVVHRALSREPRERYPNVSAFRKALMLFVD